MWMRFDKKIGYAAKSGLIKKLLSGYIVVLMLFSLFSMAFMATAGAADDKYTPPVYVPGDIDDGDGDEDKIVKDEDKIVKDEDKIVKDEDKIVKDEDKIVKDEDKIVKDEDKMKDDADDDDDAKDKIKVETVLGNISKDKETKVILENSEETDIHGVYFTPSMDLKGVKLTVSKLEYKPEEILEIPTKNNSVYVYQYLDIKLTANDEYIGEDGIESMRFEFKVKWSWINENKLHKETILLMRYHDVEWQNLTTTYLSEDDTYVYYEAETPGLSTFAVVGSELIESSASYVEEAPEVPWILNIGIIASSSTMLFVVLFKARYIYLDEEDGVKGSKKRVSRKLR
jgi:PGF-pre-PGF domain-containing protein